MATPGKSRKFFTDAEIAAAEKFITTLDQLGVRMRLEVQGKRYGLTYRARPGHEGCFAALSRHYDATAHRQEICTALMQMGRIDGGRPIAIGAHGEKIYSMK